MFSGGKDSAYSIFLAKNQGHEIKCLLSLHPKSPESHLLHHPNLAWTSLQSQSMNIPQLTVTVGSDDTALEILAIEKILKTAINRYDIEGILHGGIKSNFQRQHFENICNKLQLKSVAPLWASDPKKYMTDLISSNFDFIFL